MAKKVVAVKRKPARKARHIKQHALKGSAFKRLAKECRKQGRHTLVMYGQLATMFERAGKGEAKLR